MNTDFYDAKGGQKSGFLALEGGQKSGLKRNTRFSFCMRDLRPEGGQKSGFRSGIA